MMFENKVKIKLDCDKQERNLGWFSKDGKVFCTVRKPHHVFKKLRSFGMNELLVEDLIDKGVERIIIFYKKFNGKTWANEHVYHVKPWTVMTKGVEYRADEFEKQLMIPVSLLEEYKDEVKVND